MTLSSIAGDELNPGGAGETPSDPPPADPPPIKVATETQTKLVLS